jgi:hypothetical protein
MAGNWAGLQLNIHRIVRTDPENILITPNHRDETVYDLYRINLKTHEQTMLAQNPGDVLSWLTDDKGNLRARLRRQTENTRIFEIIERSGSIWKPLKPGDFLS